MFWCDRSCWGIENWVRSGHRVLRGTCWWVQGLLCVVRVAYTWLSFFLHASRILLSHTWPHYHESTGRRYGDSCAFLFYPLISVSFWFDIAEYRSAIYFHTQEQQTIAQRVTKEVQEKYFTPKGKKIVTEIAPASQWWNAEEYHQLYLFKNPSGYQCPTHKLHWWNFLSGRIWIATLHMVEGSARSDVPKKQREWSNLFRTRNCVWFTNSINISVLDWYRNSRLLSNDTQYGRIRCHIRALFCSWNRFLRLNSSFLNFESYSCLIHPDRALKSIDQPMQVDPHGLFLKITLPMLVRPGKVQKSYGRVYVKSKTSFLLAMKHGLDFQRYIDKISRRSKMLPKWFPPRQESREESST